MNFANEAVEDTHDNAAHSWKALGPTSRQWLDIKPIFTQLYLTENRKLKEVQNILSRRHGFNASEKMFKRRITEWRVHKNYKAKDKELLAKHVKACVDAGQDVQNISFRGRPVKIDRVKRHYKTDKRFTRLWEHLSESPDDATTVSVKEESPFSTTPKSRGASGGEGSETLKADISVAKETAPSLSLASPDQYDIELTLRHTQDAVRWQFTAFVALKPKDLQSRFPSMIPEEVRKGQTDQISAFWLGLHKGFSLFEIGKAEDAWPIFDKCCNMIQPLLHSAPLQLLSCLLVHFATPWMGLAALEEQLLGFIAAMTAQALGRTHPLSDVMRTITSPSSRQRAVETMLQIIIQGYAGRRKSTNSSLFALRVDQIDLLRKRKNFQHAHYLSQRLVQDSLSMKPKRHRSALAALGRLYADQKEEFALEGVAHRILEHETLESGFANSGNAAWAYDQLASLCMGRNEYSLAEQYLRQAASMSYAGLPHRGPSVETLAMKLVRCANREV
jgi:hypothetical protein